MKKAFLLAAMAAMILGTSLWGQSITVTSPTTGDEWCKGSNYTITWTKSGAMQATVAIRLRVAGSPESAEAAVVIANGAPNNGSYSWTVPNSVAPGNYFIRVRTDDSTVIGDSHTFLIKICGAASITVTSPTASSEWPVGSTEPISWTKSGTMQATCAIRLRTAGSAESAPAALVIADGTANDGSYNWTIPASVTPGSYFIRVRTDDSTVTDDSPNFAITPEGGGGTIDPGILERLRHMRYMVKFPIDPDPPCLCPEFDIREFRERIPDYFRGSLVLLRDGKPVHELGTFGKGHVLADTLKPKLNRENFNALKLGSSKFSLGLLNAKGVLVQQFELNLGAQEEQLR